MSKKKKTLIVSITTVLLVFALVIITTVTGTKPITYTYNPRVFTGKSTTIYDDYINGVLDNLARPQGFEQTLKGTDYTSASGNYSNYQLTVGEEEKTLLKTDGTSSVSWVVTVNQSGFYNLKLGYHIPVDTNATKYYLSRNLTITTGNDQIDKYYQDYLAKQALVFDRDIRFSVPGDEHSAYQTAYTGSTLLGYTVSYDYYLTEGENTIKLTSSNEFELLAIDYLSVTSVDTIEDFRNYTDLTADYSEYVTKITEEVIKPSHLGSGTYQIQAAKGYQGTAATQVVKASDLKNEFDQSTAKYDELLFVNDRNQVSWKVNVEKSGFYTVYLRYFTTTQNSTRSSIERRFHLTTGEPVINQVFDNTISSASYSFTRNWVSNNSSTKLNQDGNSTHAVLDVASDTNGNDVKPSQVESPTYRSSYLKDDLGYTLVPYEFYFTAGENTIALVGIREWILIDYIEIAPYDANIRYSEYKELHAELTDNAPEDFVYKIEAETAAATSSPTLYPVTDRTSSKTFPHSPSATRLNMIGETAWSILGDWITWKFDVPEDGFYKISLRGRQNLVRGMYSTRMIYIDGVAAFEELTKSIFSYSSSWQIFTLGNSEEDYEFYLTKGTHTITMEVTLGEYAPIVEYLEQTIDELSSLYLDIIRYTTAAPDANRDYLLDQKVDLNLIARLEDAKQKLEYISKSLTEISGEKSDKTGVIDNVVVQITDFIKRHRTIPGRLSSFSTNISSLGTLLTALREFPLSIDYLVVYAARGNYQLEKANEGFFRKLWDGIVSFYYSFIVDYSSIGATNDHSGATREIDVWMTLGRDQANVLRKLIDQEFTPKYGIKVNLRLTGTDVLLKAALAGVGPDVAINVDSSLPVNYGLRGAAADLIGLYSKDSDLAKANKNNPNFVSYEEFIEANFLQSVIDQFTFNGESYALPEKQIYMTMFVNTKVMKNVFGEKWEDRVPDTWEEVIDIVSDLQAESLQFWLPVNDSGATALNPIFVSMLFQSGGELYINDDMQTGLLEPIAMDIFEYWTNLYTLYSFPKYASFINRFRSGEMPIGLSYYELYNILSVFAPEMRGNWKFYPIPGTLIEDATVLDLDNNEHTISYIDHTSTSVGTGAIILDRSVQGDPQRQLDAWSFLTWWTGESAQTAFGLEMEGILGSAARHATANINAFQNLAWPQTDLEILLKQWGVVAESDKATQQYYIINGELRPYYVDDDGTIHVYGVKEIPQIAGSYITGREVENAYRTVINNNVNAKETLYEYAQNIQNEIDRKRKEFGLTIYGGKK